MIAHPFPYPRSIPFIVATQGAAARASRLLSRCLPPLSRAPSRRHRRQRWIPREGSNLASCMLRRGNHTPTKSRSTAFPKLRPRTRSPSSSPTRALSPFARSSVPLRARTPYQQGHQAHQSPPNSFAVPPPAPCKQSSHNRLRPRRPPRLASVPAINCAKPLLSRCSISNSTSSCTAR